MMKLRSVVIFLLPLILVATAGWVVIFDPIVQRRAEAISNIQAVRTQYDELSTRLAVVDGIRQTAVFPTDFSWPSDGGNAIELVVQRTILELAEEAGLEIARFGPGPTPEFKWGNVVSLNIELSGSLKNFTKLLADIEQHMPRLAISTIRIRNRAIHEQIEGTTQISANLSIWAIAGRVQ